MAGLVPRAPDISGSDAEHQDMLVLPYRHGLEIFVIIRSAVRPFQKGGYMDDVEYINQKLAPGVSTVRVGACVLIPLNLDPSLFHTT